MKNDSTPLPLREQLDAALADVRAAEQTLDDLVTELRRGANADGTPHTTAVQDAFVQLRKARAVLASVRDLMPRAWRAL